MDTPLLIFRHWFREEELIYKNEMANACCLSTIGLNGELNARYVLLEELTCEGLIITGKTSSQKGKEIQQNKAVALTFWWPHSRKQVRILGQAYPINRKVIKKYFKGKSRISQILSIVSKQSEEISNLLILSRIIGTFVDSYPNKKLKMPKDWGGFLIKPTRMELMEYKETEFHIRKDFHKEGDKWVMSFLQP